MSSDKQKLLVIGNGMASTRFLEYLSGNENNNHEVSVFGSEPHAGYNRILLSPLLSGEKTIDDVITHTDDWYQKHGINFHKGVTINSIDRDKKVIHDSNSLSHEYDKLVIATGSNPFTPPLDGSDLKNVYTYRTIEDVDHIIESSLEKKHAVVIGGGLLGLEAAYGLQIQGMDVTVLQRGSILMNQQLDETASEMLIDSLQSRGLNVITDAETNYLAGNEKVETVELKNGRSIKADLVVIAVGIRPNVTLAKDCGLEIDRAIVVNDHLQTSDENIFAFGECVQHRNITYGLVAPLYEQAAVCAEYMNGNTQAVYSGSVTATGLKVTGIELFSAGEFNEDEDCKLVTLIDKDQHIYKKLVIKNDMLIGALLFGDTTASLWFQELIENKASILDYRQMLLFGPDYIKEQNKANNSLAA